jgi:hypothetical protein
MWLRWLMLLRVSAAEQGWASHACMSTMVSCSQHGKLLLRWDCGAVVVNVQGGLLFVNWYSVQGGLLVVNWYTRIAAYVGCHRR